MVFLKYNFIFDSSDTWSNLSEFENTLAKYFEEHDMEAKIIQTVSGQVGDRLMLISRCEPKPNVDMPKENTTPIVVSQKKQQTIAKGGTPMPKVPDKTRVFSMKKGRKLREVYKGNTKLGGVK
jgi:hypothetical protein